MSIAPSEAPETQPDNPTDDRPIIADTKPVRAIDQALKQRVRNQFQMHAAQRRDFRQRNSYYYKCLLDRLRFIIPPGQRILEVGCADGYVLHELNPSEGVGVDFSAGMIEQAEQLKNEKNADHLHFVEGDIECVTFGRQFDYIVLSDVIGSLLDIQTALENLRSACHAETRIVIHYHSVLWEPVLRLAERFGMKMPQPLHNWLARSDMESFTTLADFETVRYERGILMPKGIPLIAPLINRFLAPLPLINSLSLMNLWVLRMRERAEPKPLSTTILIPCRNEKGNIEDAIKRIPRFGTEQEIIYVDGHSDDGTPEEIQRVIEAYPAHDIRFFVQPGKGKGDAVRHGFDKATKDILMILDADLTMPPEDLPKFYDAIASGKGEFINGTRLVYPMEQEAMRFLNMLGNKFFSVTLSWLLGQRLRDTLCGTKVLSRTDYRKIVAGRSFFGDFDPFGDFDLLFGAVKQNLRIVEVPIRYRDRAYGRTNISRFRHGLLLLRMTAYAFRRLKLW